MMEEDTDHMLINELDAMAFVYFEREMREEAAQTLRLAQQIRDRVERDNSDSPDYDSEANGE